MQTLHQQNSAKLKIGKMSIEDDARSGRPIEAVTDEYIKKVDRDS
jgi:hypothetical protein